MIAKDYGFILKRYNFRETSLIASIYTLNYGKIKGIFKGFYALKKEFTSSLDVFTLNEIIFYPKKSDLWLISYADLKEDYFYLRTNLETSQAAAAIFNIVNNAVADGDRNPALFYLIKTSMHYLKDYPHFKVICIFLIKFLTLVGFKLHLSHCLRCQVSLSRDIYFAPREGGLLCLKCSKEYPSANKITPDVSSILFYIQRSAFKTALRINPSSECIFKMLYFLREFFLYHLEMDITKFFKIKYELRR